MCTIKSSRAIRIGRVTLLLFAWGIAGLLLPSGLLRVLGKPVPLVAYAAPLLQATNANLSIVQNELPGPVEAGTTVIYTLAVSNNGPADATGVVVTDQLPQEVVFRSATSTQGSCTETGGTVICNINSLLISGSASIQIAAMVKCATPGTITNGASVTANEPDPDQSNNSVTTSTSVGDLAPLIFASNRNTRFQIWRASLNPLGTPNQLTFIGSASQESRNPDWSAAADRIAFQFGASGVRGIRIVHTDGSSDVRLTFDPSDERDPSWSPDGRYIAYSFLIGGDYDIYIHDTNNTPDNSSDDAEIFFWGLVGTQETRPAWSPDGTRIAFVTTTNGGDNEIVWANVVYANGTPGAGTASLLTSNSYNDFDPAWSPDSRQIVFSSNRTGNGDIFRMDAIYGESDPDSLVQLTSNSANDLNPSWSSDIGGGCIAFVSERDGNREIYLMSSEDGAGQVRITNDPSSDDDPAWGESEAPQEADLSLELVDSPDPVIPGNVLKYKATITNNGPSNATGVTVRDVLPAQVTFEPASSSATCMDTGGTVTCSVGSLAAGQSIEATIAISVSVDITSTTLGNTVSLTGAEADPDPTNNTVTINTDINAWPIRIFDPVPALVCNPDEAYCDSYITTDASLLGLDSASQTVQGVAADGIARVILSFDAPEPGLVEFALLIDTGTPWDELKDGSLQSMRNVGTSTSSGPTQLVRVNTVGTGDKAFIIYNAPRQFIRTEFSDRTEKHRFARVSVRFIPTNLNTPEQKLPEPVFITIVRPPVFLVHGTWSNPGMWDVLEEKFGEGGDETSHFYLCKADYEANNADWIVNKPSAGKPYDPPPLGRPTVDIVNDQLNACILVYKSVWKVASVQADVVTHSVGGQVIRAIPIFRNDAYRLKENYQRGSIRRIINIDSTLRGTLFGTRVEDAYAKAKAFAKSRPEFQERFDWAEWAFGHALELPKLWKKIPNVLTRGIVFDQNLYSQYSNPPLIEELSARAVDIPTHNIVGEANADQVALSGPLPFFMTWAQCGLPKAGLPGGDPPDISNDQIFDGQSHDMVVQTQSQRGFSTTPGTRTELPGVVHSGGLSALPHFEGGSPKPIFIGPVVYETQTVADRIVHLLYEPAGSSAFERASDGIPLSRADKPSALNCGPTARAGGPYAGIPNQPVTLDGHRSIDEDGLINKYEWDLNNDGDFTDATGVPVVHTFPAIGCYTVRLRVTDDGGKSNIDKAQVSVAPTSMPAPCIPILPARAYAGDEAIRIVSPAAGSSFQPGEQITVTVETNPAAGIDAILVSGAGNLVFDSAEGFETVLTVPDEFLGVMDIHAIGGNREDQVFEDEVSVNINTPAHAVSMTVEPSMLILPNSGLTGRLRVKGDFDDGVTRALDGLSGLAFSSDNPGVAVIDASGVITAVAKGQATVTASYSGLSASASVTVESSNRLPVASAGGSSEVAPGQAVHLDGSLSYDPDGDPLTYSWKVLSVPAGSSVSTGSLSDPAAANPTFMPDVQGSYVVTLQISDTIGGMSSDVANIQVRPPNEPPHADPGGPYSVPEGTPFSLDATNSSDPDGTIIAYTWDVDNDDQFDDAISYKPMVSFGDNGSYVVRVSVADDAGASATAAATVTISNVDPAVWAGSDQEATIDVPVRLVDTTFADPGTLDVHAATVNWGDGNVEPATVTEDRGSGIVNASHRYSAVGKYTVHVQVCDDDGGCGTDTLSVTVARKVFLPIILR